MQSKLNPYINFKDQTREAMEFYQSVFGGKLRMNTFKDFHASQDPNDDDKIMHAVLEADNGISFFASDMPNYRDYQPGTNFSMSLTGDNEAELSAYFEKLSAGGMVTQPLVKAMWGDAFGMCIDRYGVTWLVNITAQPA
jgi:PhnB protein